MYTLSDAIIIGITGSYGKTSVAYLVHEYLKSIGKKSVLFSSCLIDSPSGQHPNGAGMEFTFGTERQIAKVLQEALEYEAEYIILECWEHSINAGVFDNVPFDIKCITRLANRGNAYIDKEAYFQSKLKFFQDEEDAICLLSLEGLRLGQLITDSNMPFENIRLMDVFYPTLYRPNEEASLYDHSIDALHLPVPYAILNPVLGLEEQSATLKLNDKNVNINTTLAVPHLKNILMAAAILNEANIFDEEDFISFIGDENLTIPGRMEDIEWNGRTIIIDSWRSQCLIFANDVAQNRPIKIVDSAIFDENCFDEEYRKTHPEFEHEEELKIVAWTTNRYASYSYFTSNNMGKFTWEEVKEEYDKVCTIPHECIKDRREAIKKALLDSQPGDIICIANRGNRRLMFLSYTYATTFIDKNVLLSVIEEIDNENK